MSNFAILRVQKVKTMSSMAARGRHNFREQDTPNADGDRLGLNVAEGAQSTDELLKAVSDLLPSKRRKDAVIGLEYLITASPEYFGDDWQGTKMHGQDYFKDAISWLEAKHGKDNVVCKMVHLDESTPHLAAFVVPLVNGKLNAKAFTGGSKLLAQMQTDFAGLVGVKHGLDRGIERSKAVHQDNAKIKAMTVERLALKKSVKLLQGEVDRLTKSTAEGGAAQVALAKMQGELAKAQDKITRQQALNVANMHLINKIEGGAKIMVKALATATERDHELVAEITGLREANATAQPTLEQLRAIDRVIVDQARDRLEKEAQEAAKAAQEAFSVKWAGAREATAIDLKHLPVEAVCGNQVVYNLGRGNFSIHTFASGEIVPKMRNDTEQKRNEKGISR